MSDIISLRMSRLMMVFFALFVMVLQGCGGGGGGDTPPSSSAPVITSGAAIEMPENSTATGYIATATDADGDTVGFSLSGGADKEKFAIVGNSGALSFLTAPDFETPTSSGDNNSYVVEISASDSSHSVTKQVTVTVTDIAGAPVFTSSSSSSVPENSSDSGYTATAIDDEGDAVSYSITGGEDRDAFNIDSSSGVLSFSARPDFEDPADSDEHNDYEVEITASDSINSVMQSVIIVITDVSGAPAFTSSTAHTLAENSVVTGYVASATDDEGDTITFSLSEKGDGGLFNLDSNGVLNFNEAPDFEDNNNSYVVEISASDGTHHSVAQRVTINVTNLNDNAPEMTSATSSTAAENNVATEYVASASDDDEGDTITYSLSEEEDGNLFTLDSNSGVLSFKVAPDFEDNNNSYVVEISASDGPHSVAQRVTINVTNVNEAPVFTSGTSINVKENGTATGYIATVADPEDDIITFRLSGGIDQDQFNIDSSSGVLSFKAAPDFEGNHNSYVVEISASDGTRSVAQSITIVVVLFDVTVSSADVKTIRFDWPTYPGATSYKLLANPDGVSGFTEVQGNLTGTSATLELSVHLTDWINASYLIEAHDGSGKLTETAAVTISSLMLSSIGYVKASDASSGSFFGGAVSLSDDGSTLAVGATNAGGIAGLVYVFSRSEAGWLQEAYLRASHAGFFDSFGKAVSLSADGNTLAVGAYSEDSSVRGISTDGTDGGDNAASNAGAVYLFSRSDSGWSQQAYVKASNTGEGDQFGYAVSLSADGNTLAVGASREKSNATGISADGTGEDDNTASNAGAVYLFSRSDSGWSQQAYVKASNTDGGDEFGFAVSLSIDGNTLAVGAYSEDSSARGISADGTGEGDNTAARAGAVYLFSRSDSGWSQQAYVKASNTGEGDRFGYAVSLSTDGNTLAVGARNEDSNASGIGGEQGDDTESSSGAVYLY